jgi:hypothetical protein
MNPIPVDVFEFFASDPTGPYSNLRRVAYDSSSKIHSSLDSFLEEIPADIVEQTQRDSQFQWFWGSALNADREARIWIAERFVSQEISRRRIELLREEYAEDRPQPYSIEALNDVRVDDEHMVSLSEFEFDGSRLLRNRYAFTILSTTGSPNSTYWLLNLLYQQNLAKLARVRLDPLLFGPAERFPSVFYRMLVYGRPLDWGKISHLRKTEHGRWFPDSLSRTSAFTDYCWEPRENEVSFLCEEVPLVETVSTEVARYLHAIYAYGNQTIKHLDGALRLYTTDDIGRRHDQHLRNTGKAGIREKVFRTDEPISRDNFSLLTQAFFIWNRDVQKYFTQVVASAS